MISDGPDKFFRDVRSPLAKLCASQEVPVRVFAFGGAGDRFGAACRWAVRALSADESQRAVGDAVKWLVATGGWAREDLYTELGEAVLDLESKVRALALGLVDPDDATRPMAKDADELRKLLDADEVARLFNELRDFTDERSPLARARTWEEVEGLLVAVGKGQTTPTSLSSYDADSLRFMLRELASRHYAPTRPRSSATSPLSARSASSTDPTATCSPTE